VTRGLDDGSLRVGVMRVSARKRHEAYVTVDGVPHDVKFDGFDARNRTVDGDVVVFAIDPVEFWPPLEETRWNDTPARADGACAGGRAKQRQRKREARAAAEASAAARAGDAADTKRVSAPTTATSTASEDDGGDAAVRRGMRDLSVHPLDDPSDDDPSDDDPSDDAASDDAAGASDDGALGAAESPGPDDETRLLAEAARSGGVGGAPLRPVGRVVAVHETSPRRDVVTGYLDLADAEPRSRGAGPPALRFFPSDPKLPLMRVETGETGSVPPEVRAAAASADGMETLRKRLVVARLDSWPPAQTHPACVVTEVLGDAEDLATATAALVAEHAVLGADAFSAEALRCLPEVPVFTDPVTGRAARRWTVPERERSARRDFTKTRVVSIDPPTARDLDDALHCERLPDGGVRVGVHIADVSFFVEAGSALDAEARRRGTSTYLVNEVMPMLPRLLCEDLCSLNPGVERLTFSAEWEMSAEGEVRAEWFGRGVIRSCAKLDYGTAQAVIDARDAGGSGAEALEESVMRSSANGDGPVKIDDAGAANGSLWDAVSVAEAVGDLNRAARAMRARRFAGGALRLDQAKLLFRLDSETGSPVSVFPYQTRESNHLVEEFMLLANAAAARLVAAAFPERAMLRCHPPPNERKLADLEQFAREQGLEVDASSAAALHRSLARLRESHRDGYEIVQLLATLPMQLARYFSTGAQDPDTWGHYALAAPRYTHFTSPIRRYPDVLVHRQVAAALDAGFTPSGFRGGILGERGAAAPPAPRGGRAAAAAAADAFGLPDSETLKAYAAHCNERKLAAKAVQDGSSHAYLCAYLRASPTVASGIVRAAGRKYLRVFIPAFGCEARVPVEGLRHVTATSAGPGAGADAVALAFEPTATPEDLRMASDPDAARDARKRAMKASRGARGPYLNVSEAEHAALRDAEASASASPRGERSDDEDVFACGAPPRRLPATIRPVERVCLLLGATFPARAKPEMTAALLLRNPLAEA
jgi:DIS3-like exonuclease 2